MSPALASGMPRAKRRGSRGDVTAVAGAAGRKRQCRNASLMRCCAPTRMLPFSALRPAITLRTKRSSSSPTRARSYNFSHTGYKPWLNRAPIACRAEQVNPTRPVRDDECLRRGQNVPALRNGQQSALVSGHRYGQRSPPDGRLLVCRTVISAGWRMPPRPHADTATTGGGGTPEARRQGCRPGPAPSTGARLPRKESHEKNPYQQAPSSSQPAARVTVAGLARPRDYARQTACRAFRA